MKNELLHTGNVKKETFYTKRRKTNWIGDILRRKCLLKCVIEGET